MLAELLPGVIVAVGVIAALAVLAFLPKVEAWSRRLADSFRELRTDLKDAFGRKQDRDLMKRVRKLTDELYTRRGRPLDDEDETEGDGTNGHFR